VVAHVSLRAVSQCQRKLWLNFSTLPLMEMEYIMATDEYTLLVVDLPDDVWHRGHRDLYLLRTPEGKMCCIGLLCRAEGLTDADMEDKGVLAELDPQVLTPRLRRVMGIHKSGLDHYSINDNPFSGYDDTAIRVAALNDAMQQVGVQFTWTKKPL